ncbi:MAG: hypothetical protein AB1500_04940 [Bacillota bacterium]
MKEAKERYPVKLFAYCLMPNHFHMVLAPALAGDLNVKGRVIVTTKDRLGIFMVCQKNRAHHTRLIFLKRYSFSCRPYDTRFRLIVRSLVKINRPLKFKIL